jgi:hypothetical protein
LPLILTLQRANPHAASFLPKIAFVGVFDPSSRKMVAWNCLIAVLVVEVLFTVSYDVNQDTW